MSRNLAKTFGLVALLAAPCLAQGPDILIPSGSLDGSFRLVDRDNDSKYTTDGEAYDYILANTDTSPRNFVRIGANFYFTDTLADQIVYVSDTNNNGLIEASERKVFFDAKKAFGASDPNFLALDNQGWLWWSNDDGTAEGLLKSKDLNNDGDAEDPGETVQVLVEPKTVQVANTPNYQAANNGALPVLSLTNLDSIMFDPTAKPNGRFICEEENFDQSIAFHDKNNDGDFEDPGEVYVFCALYNGGTLGPDVNPDVKNNVLPSANEVHGHVVDPTTGIYYMMSIDTSATQLDAGIIFRGEDKNNDGDVNDPGETTIFWDGSLDSTGATTGYNFCYGMAIFKGKLYVTAEWDAARDHERLLYLSDNNNDGDANDAGETIVLWDFPADQTHYTPFVSDVPLAAAPPGLPSRALYYGDATCPSSLSSTAAHNIQVGSDNFNGRPLIGNTSWVVRTWGAAPAAPGIYGLSTTKIAGGIALDKGQQCHIYHNWDFLIAAFVTDTNGQFNQTLPLPNDKAFIGLWTYWQSLVIDAGSSAGLGFTVSDAFEMRLGTYSYTID